MDHNNANDMLMSSSMMKVEPIGADGDDQLLPTTIDDISLDVLNRPTNQVVNHNQDIANQDVGAGEDTDTGNEIVTANSVDDITDMLTSESSSSSTMTTTVTAIDATANIINKNNHQLVDNRPKTMSSIMTKTAKPMYCYILKNGQSLAINAADATKLTPDIIEKIRQKFTTTTTTTTTADISLPKVITVKKVVTKPIQNTRKSVNNNRHQSLVSTTTTTVPISTSSSSAIIRPLSSSSLSSTTMTTNSSSSSSYGNQQTITNNNNNNRQEVPSMPKIVRIRPMFGFNDKTTSSGNNNNNNNNRIIDDNVVEVVDNDKQEVEEVCQISSPSTTITTAIADAVVSYVKENTESNVGHQMPKKIYFKASGYKQSANTSTDNCNNNNNNKKRFTGLLCNRYGFRTPFGGYPTVVTNNTGTASHGATTRVVNQTTPTTTTTTTTTTKMTTSLDNKSKFELELQPKPEYLKLVGQPIGLQVKRVVINMKRALELRGHSKRSHIIYEICYLTGLSRKLISRIMREYDRTGGQMVDPKITRNRPLKFKGDSPADRQIIDKFVLNYQQLNERRPTIQEVYNGLAVATNRDLTFSGCNIGTFHRIYKSMGFKPPEPLHTHKVLKQVSQIVTRKDCAMLGQVLESGEKRYPCHWPECGKVYKVSASLRVHLNVHNNVKPYLCQWSGCDYRSATYSNVLIHYKRKHEK